MKEDDVLDKITPLLKKNKHINDATRYKLETFSEPIILLTPERIDLIAKIKYIDYLEGKDRSNFVQNLYKAHLTAFSEGGKCSEPGDKNKNSFKDYVESFKNTAANIKNHGFSSALSLVPVGNDNIIMDGAHRVSSAIYYHKSVEGIIFPGMRSTFDYKFFSKNMLEEKYLDYMTLEYCRLKKNTFVFCIWPKADKNKREDAFKLIRENTRVIYEKEIDLTYLGYRNFIIQVYRDFSHWIGSSNDHYEGANSQLDSCYAPGVPLKIFVVEAESKQQIINIKKRARDIFHIGNFSIHSTDTQRETVYMLELLLNQNSVDLLNNGKPDAYAKLDRTINHIRQEMVGHDLSSDNFIVVSSSVLGLYGIRCPNDIDFLAKNQNYNVLEAERSNNSKYISCQNHYVYDFKNRDSDNKNLYGMSFDELLYNPDNYLFYNGVKFITLETLMVYKVNRDEKKDRIDVDAIVQFRKNNAKTWYVYIKKLSMFYRQSVGKTKLAIIRMLRKMHLYNIVYRIVRGKTT